MKLPSAAFSGLRKQWLKLAVQLVDADTTNAKGHVTKYGGKLALHFLSTKDTAKFDKYLAMVKKHDPKAATNIEIEAELMKLQQGARRDPAGTLTKLKALLGRGATGEALQKIHWMLAGMTFRSDKAAAKVHLEKALAAAPNSEIGKQIPNILKRAFKGH